MMENALSILIVIFSVQLQQTEISERKLFIFHLGCKGCNSKTNENFEKPGIFLSCYSKNYYNL